MKNQKREISIILALALVFSIAIELCLFSVNYIIEFNGEKSSLLSPTDYLIETYGYTMNDNMFVPVDGDPQFVFSDVDSVVKTVYIQFGQRLTQSVNVQAFYAKENDDFTIDNCTSITTAGMGADSIMLTLPGEEYEKLRIDIDGSFSLSDITISNSEATRTAVFEDFNILHVILMFAVISVALFVFIKWCKTEKTGKVLTIFEFIFCAVCFGYYFLWILKPYNYGPDEAMRYDVSKFFFENNRLPVGTEAANPIWGFSYALLPTMLCNVLDYIPMKLASLFTSNDYYILLSARLVSVCCGALTVYFIIKASKLLFKSSARWIMIVLIAAMPQFAFLSSYINNDIVALLGISMIFYAWVLAINENWNFKNALLLSVGMSVCALAYYNSYTWILASIFIYFVTYFYKNKKDFKGFVKMSAFIVIITLALISYFFVRHLYLYGDLLGFNVTHEYGEKYGDPSFKPSGRGTPLSNGLSLVYMLITMNWISTTYKSFIGCFGYMSYLLKDTVYSFYKIFFVVAILGLALLAIKILFNLKKKKPTLEQIVLVFSLIACAGITICLSIYNSYTTDYQPQGRYCYPALPAIAYFAARGIETLTLFFKKKEQRVAVVSAICAVMIAISVDAYYNVLLLT